MSILSRYLLRTYLPSFLLALGVFIFVLLMNHFLRLFSLAVMKGIPLSWIFYCFARLLPYFLSLALPMAYLVGLLLTLGQFSESGEVMALRSAGYSFREMLTPFFALAAGLSLLLLYVNHKASPEGFHAFKNALTSAASWAVRLDLEPRTLVPLGDWEFYAERVDAETGRLGGVRLVKKSGEYKRLRVLAPEGRSRLEPGRGLWLELSSGTFQWPNQDPASLTSSTFGRYELLISFEESHMAHRPPDIQELNTTHLREMLRSPDISTSQRCVYATEAALRSAGASAPLVLFWTACPLGLRLEKRSRATAFALSLLVIFAYYGLLVLGVGLGRRSLALSDWAPWLPNVVCLASGAGLWRKELRR